MVGIYGTIGHEPTAETGAWSDRHVVSRYVDADISIQLGTHRLLSDEQPVVLDDGIYVWVLGETYGFDDTSLGGSTGHQPRPKRVDSASHCARLYETYGLEFASGLNGNCVVVVYDEQSRNLSIITDRLGTVPIYYAQPGDGLVFSTDIEAVAGHPAVETAFDLDYLHEYLVFRRTFGVKTPLAGIEELQPASVSTVDVNTGSVEVERYWQPRYRPRDVPFEQFVDEFVETFERVIDEWHRDDLRYGVLLSGGSDSRLNLAALDPGVTAFHMGDWMNREARTAEQVAIESDSEFVFLKRDLDYQARALERNRRFSNFNGWFTQGYATGFEDEITSRVDALLSGMYADTLFKDIVIPSPTYSFGRMGNLTLPTESTIGSLPEFIDWLLETAPGNDTLPLPSDLCSVLEANIYWDGDEIVHHGVRYETIEDLVYCSGYFPLTNDDDIIFRNSLRNMLPYRTPFLDNRLVELSLRMPIRYRLRRNLINAAVKRLDPKLAAVPHAQTGLDLDHSFPVEYFGRTFNALWRKHVSEETPPQPHLTHGSWVDNAELIRTDDFFWNAINSHRDAINGLSVLDFDDVRECYRAHLEGENNVVELYTLLTVLNMPITEELAGIHPDNHIDRTIPTPPERTDGE